MASYGPRRYGSKVSGTSSGRIVGRTAVANLAALHRLLQRIIDLVQQLRRLRQPLLEIVSERQEPMNWLKMYDYPTHLVKLRQGDVGLFVCAPAWRGRLGTVCALWVRLNTDWHALTPSGAQTFHAFWTRAHPRGLLVGRGTVRVGSRGRDPAQVLAVEPDTPSTGDPAKLVKLLTSWADLSN
jgi:hypothetical protein